MIKNSEEANKYYKLVNEYIDKYLEDWKIDPTNLKKYLDKKRLARFIEKKGLKDIKNIEIVINDTIEDRISMEKDKIMKFESYIISESSSDLKIQEISQCLYIGMGKSNIEHEKLLADYFDVSLSQIDIVNSESHKFKIDEVEYVIYTKEEMGIISNNLSLYSISKIMSKKLSIDLSGINLEIDSFLNNESLEKSIKMKIDENIQNIVSNILNCKIIKENKKFFIGEV